MKILLFNDNPVVRKLVALSAQKTKDDLSVVWSVDEIEGTEYDLLIMDDALYNDETFESLNNKINVKSTLLMATRGNGVPEGFEHVINKPFLPTDLVDLLVRIEKKTTDSSVETQTAQTPVYSINLEESLPELESSDMELPEIESLDDDEFDFGNLEDLDEKLPETNVLDQEEVQEVRDLLEDTEELMDDDIVVQGIHDEEDLVLDDSEEMKLDDLSLEDPIGEDLKFDDLLDDDLLQNDDVSDKEILDEDAFGDIEFTEQSEDEEPLGAPLEEAIDFDEGLLEEPAGTIDDLVLDESMIEDMDISGLTDDENYLDSLEAKINDAVNSLGSDELDQELSPEDLDESLMADLNLDETVEGEKEPLSGFDELDMLDELELKRAIGEEVEDEDLQNDQIIDIDDLDEVAMDEAEELAEVAQPISNETAASHTDGVEALQTLLKALSNEDVAKSLKGMNISININFGNDK